MAPRGSSPRPGRAGGGASTRRPSQLFNRRAVLSDVAGCVRRNARAEVGVRLLQRGEDGSKTVEISKVPCHRRLAAQEPMTIPFVGYCFGGAVDVHLGSCCLMLRSSDRHLVDPTAPDAMKRSSRGQ